MNKTYQTKPIRYKEYWLLRVIAEDGLKKSVYKEVEFEKEPTTEDIIKTLLEVPSNCFVSVEHNYRILDK